MSERNPGETSGTNGREGRGMSGANEREGRGMSGTNEREGGNTNGKTRWEAGDATRRAVLGDEHVDRAVASTTPFTADFQEFITRYAWGEIWTRPGLDRRTRSCVTLAVLAALGHEHELALHVRAALRVGLTEEEIKEVLLQTAIYAGVPAANRAFAVARAALEFDRNEEGGDDRTG
ncbi:4-carboxymuconolactone decarboxylase [Streptosporangium sp. NBC_01469]|uniref:4-carboxymuconolactone decarboxylase n=2 Tax=unclassified Streptosporangium TaxID=2632669 RepID=UPI002E2BD4FA|nr:4-carboxymuconolactone decarboxylase [Streptosporangium sp. NBC_01469]